MQLKPRLLRAQRLSKSGERCYSWGLQLRSEMEIGSHSSGQTNYRHLNLTHPSRGSKNAISYRGNLPFLGITPATDSMCISHVLKIVTDLGHNSRDAERQGWRLDALYFL